MSLEAEFKRCKVKNRKMAMGYHGTVRKKVADKILQEGFKQGSFFATHLEDAIGFGGEYVFEVAFCMDFKPRGGWQWVEKDGVPPERIVTLNKFNKEQLFENDVVRDAVFKHNIELMGDGD